MTLVCWRRNPTCCRLDNASARGWSAALASLQRAERHGGSQSGAVRALLVLFVRKHLGRHRKLPSSLVCGSV